MKKYHSPPILNVVVLILGPNLECCCCLYVQGRIQERMVNSLSALFSSIPSKFKVGGLRPVQQPGSYWNRSSALPLVVVEPTER